MCAWVAAQSHRNTLERLLHARKHVLPRRRYAVLFRERLTYFAEASVKLGAWAARHVAATGSLGIELNEFNTIIDVGTSAEARHLLRAGDVLLEVDGTDSKGKRLTVDVVGAAVEWTRWHSLLALKVMRIKGYVPLSRGTEVRPCRTLLNRVNADACAFEIDLTRAARRAGMGAPRKTRYVFICSGREEAENWLVEIRAVVQLNEPRPGETLAVRGAPPDEDGEDAGGATRGQASFR